jgi:hypothetical protein
MKTSDTQGSRARDINNDSTLSASTRWHRNDRQAGLVHNQSGKRAAGRPRWRSSAGQVRQTRATIHADELPDGLAAEFHRLREILATGFAERIAG